MIEMGMRGHDRHELRGTVTAQERHHHPAARISLWPAGPAID